MHLKRTKALSDNQHSMVYKFSCPLCHAEYIGLATRHLFQRIEEHCRSSSSICRHLQQDHDTSPRSLDLAKNFAVLRKCQGKMVQDCLVYEMLLIKKYRPGGRERLYCFPLFAHGQLITTSVTSHSNRSKLSLAWLV